MKSREIPGQQFTDKEYRITRITAICAIVAVAISLLTASFIYCFQFLPQEKRAEVRFSLVQTAAMLDRAQDFVEKNPFMPEQDKAITDAGKQFRDGWISYDNKHYDDALEKFRTARLIIYDAFPPDQIPSIYYPFIPYPEQY